MFSFFRPTCPCDPEAKRWVEERLRWLSAHFGLHILLERPIILPTPEFFPDPWDGTAKAVKKMFRRVCRYMQVDPDDMELELFNDSTSAPQRELDPTYAAGLWSESEKFGKKGTVRLEKVGVYRPADLVGTIAHELAHQKLLGERRLERNAFDNELLTDLTAIYHGFGIFLANGPHKATGALSYWPGTKLRRPEYLSEPMMGYALAHIAWFRDEERPAWAKHLRWVAHGPFKQGLKFLQRTAESSFKPVRLRDDDVQK